MLLLNQNDKRAPENHLKISTVSEICGMGGGALNRKSLLHGLENIKYLNNMVDVLNSSAEFEGVLEGLFSSCISRLFIAKNFRRRERLGGL
jgi:hypothetical protein